MKSRRRSKKKIRYISFFTHSIMLLIGFTFGIYLLPIITAPEIPTKEEFQKAIDNAEYETFFVKDLSGSNLIYWGKGQLSLSKNTIAFQGKISPGATYKLYLTKAAMKDPHYDANEA